MTARARVRARVRVVTARRPVPGSPAPRRRATAGAVRVVGVALTVVAAVSACGARGSSGAAQVAAPVPAAGASDGSAVAVPDGAASSSAPAPAGSPEASAGASAPPSTAADGTTTTTMKVNSRRAVAGRGTLVVRTVPSGSAKVLTRLPATTPLGSPRVLLVRQVRAGWVQVVLPIRPNGVTGWVAASAVRVETMHDWIGVDLNTRRMTVILDGAQVVDTPVAIGSRANPTPTGTFYVTDRVRPADPGGAYGAFALGLSAHSTTLSEFGNGDGQVGIHGTNVPASIGKAVSHGCVRVPDRAATVLARVPLGTPVIIR